MTTQDDRDQSETLSSRMSSTSSTSSSACSIGPVSGRAFAVTDPVVTLQTNVEQTIDKLFRLSAIIRSAGMSYRYAKAANFVEYENEVNLTQKFREGVELLFKHKHPPPCSYMVRRLVESICLRQRQLAYSQRQKGGRQNAVQSTVYTATYVPTEVSFPTRPIAPSAATQKFSKIDDALGNLPPSPQIPPKPELECPYCAIPFERAKFEGSAWRYYMIYSFVVSLGPGQLS